MQEIIKILDETPEVRIAFLPNIKLGSVFVDSGSQESDEFVDRKWDLLIKEILALANGDIVNSEEPGYLIIGMDSSRQSYDMGHLSLTAKQVLDKVNGACTPDLSNIGCEEVLIDGKKIYVLEIEPSPEVYETTRELHIDEKKSVPAHVVFIREEDGSVVASTEQRQELEEDKSSTNIFLATPTLSLNEFLVTEDMQARLESTFVHFNRYSEAASILEQKGILWVIGSPGIGKRTLALKLALNQKNRLIYRLPRFIKWSELETAQHKVTIEHISNPMQNAISINSKLYSKLSAALPECPPFTNHLDLNALFIHQHISVWRHHIPEANNTTLRIKALIEFLYPRYHPSSHENGLVLFLRVLSDNISSDDIRELLLRSADELESEILESESKDNTSLVIENETRFVKAQAQKLDRPATFILSDALGSVRFEREEVEDELIHLKKMLEKGHKIIITSPDDVFQEATRETRLRKWISEVAVKPFKLTQHHYSYKAKKDMFEKITDYAYATGIITSRQSDLARGLLNKNNKKIKNKSTSNLAINYDLFQRLMQSSWLPIDIERFIFVSLPAARQDNDIYDLLRRDANINSRINSWFMRLDNSTRCFIFTLTLLAGQPSDVLWKRYKEIVEELRKLDPNLSALPLGVLRQRAIPYVTVDGPIDFINPRIYAAVTNEVAKNYREYFLELKPLFKTWSIPQENDNNFVKETKSTRYALARMVGEIGRYGLEDVTDILNAWGGNKIEPIRIATSIALKQTASDPACTEVVLNLIQKWLNKDLRASNDESRNRRWTVGATVWRIAFIQRSSINLEDFALNSLRQLTKDQHHYVATSAAYALFKMARNVSVLKMSSVLTRLAKRNDKRIRKEISKVIEIASRWNKTNVQNLLEEWIASQASNLHRTAVYVLLVGKAKHDKRYDQLANLLEIDSNIFVDSLTEAMSDAQNRNTYQRALSVLEGFILDRDIPTRIRIAYMIDDLVSKNQSLTYKLLESWKDSAEKPTLWALNYVLFTSKNMSEDERMTRLILQVDVNKTVFICALDQALTDDERRADAKLRLWKLLDNSDNVCWQVAEALDMAFIDAKDSAENVLKKFSDSIDNKVQRTLFYALLTGNNITNQQKYIISSIKHKHNKKMKSVAFSEAVFLSLEDNSETFWPIFRDLADQHRTLLIYSFATVAQERPSLWESLHYRLSTISDQAVIALLEGVDEEISNSRFPNISKLSNMINKWF